MKLIPLSQPKADRSEGFHSRHRTVDPQTLDLQTLNPQILDLQILDPQTLDLQTLDPQATECCSNSKSGRLRSVDLQTLDTQIPSNPVV